jgi:hypothetical protein
LREIVVRPVRIKSNDIAQIKPDERLWDFFNNIGV